MTLGGALAVVASVFTLGPLGRVDVESSVRTTSTARQIDERIGVAAERRDEDRRLLELTLEPRAVLRNDARLRLNLAYAPRLHLAFEEVSSGVGPSAQTVPIERTSLLHNAELRAERDWGRWTLRGRADATYGSLDPFDRDTLGEQPIVTTSRLHYRSLLVSAGFTTLPWQTGTLTVGATASLTGGDGQLARARLPTHLELRLDSSLEIDASYRDTYDLLLSLSRSEVERGGDSLTARGGGRWTRSLTRSHTLRLAAGGAAVLQQLEAVPGVESPAPAPASNLGPWGLASLAYLPGARSPSLTVGVGLEPTVDRISGAVDYRGAADARTVWAPFESWEGSLSGFLGILQPWLGREEQEAERTWTGGAELQIRRELGPYFFAAVSVSSTWQESGRQDLASFRELGATLQVVATLPP